MLTARGIDLSDYVTSLGVIGRGPVSQELERKSIPNHAGSYYQGSRTPERVITYRFLLKGTDMYELRTNMDELNILLYPDDLTEEEQLKGYSLVFSDEPDMTYYGLPGGTPNWMEISDKGIGEIEFICFDPHKYGTEEVQTLNSTTENVVYNGGGKETYPIVEATILQPTTFFALYSPTEFMMLGAPVEIDTTPLEKEEQVLHNGGETTTGLANGTFVDGGAVSGEMISQGSVLKASDFGVGSDWHGPAKKVSLPDPIQDFKVNAYITLESADADMVGRVEIYLLDASNNVIGKMSMKDTSASVRGNAAEVRVGDGATNHFVMNRKNREWTPFRHGIISLERIGKKFTAYVAQRDENNTNKHYDVKKGYFTDVDLEYQQDLAQIQVHVAQHGTKATPNMAIHAFDVFKINQNTEVQIPYIAMPGDVITIDHGTNDIRKNGENFKKAKDFGSSLFPLQRGSNTLAVYPNGVADVELKWRERWL